MAGGRRSRVGVRRSRRSPGCRAAIFVEPLEQRTLLSAAPSAAPGVFVRPGAVVLRPVSPAAPAASTLQGFTPAQVRHAYGFDLATFDNGTVPADGQGQTIAIVDPFDDPKIAADLAVFDTQFNLPAPPSLKAVDHNGGKNLPRSDAGWASEISLDVEWAHAIAPKAGLLLVEAASDGLDDLLAAVRYARTVPGVSVVSMSWGGGEFFGFNGKEFTGEIQDDSAFLTPAGHPGVTFVTAAGDNGPAQGAGYPGESPNVLSVGGTALTLQGNDQTAVAAYGSETTWSQTGGGYSQIEPEPAYQLAAQNTGSRSTPDVAYNADPDTGFAVYDSIPYQSLTGWQDIGGNSAGTPQWAALVALADQGRALAGQGSLDGATQTLPALYGLYAAPGTDGYANYASNFNDVIDTTNGKPDTSLASTAGYDTATGLGSPKADHVIAALVATTLSSPSSPTGPTPSPAPDPTSTPTPTPVPTPVPSATPLPTSPLAGDFTTSPPGAVLDGDKGSLKLRLTNATASRFSGPLSVTLYASGTASLAPDATAFSTLALPPLRLGSHASRTQTLRFTYPTDLPDGSYYVVASVDATGTDTAAATAVTAVPVMIASPKPDLASTFAGNTPVAVNPGRHASARLTVQNLGNLKSSAMLSVRLYASPNPSTNPAADPSAKLLISVPARKFTIRPGQSKDMSIRFVAPKGDTGGTYFLSAAVTSIQPPDRTPSLHVAVIGTM